MNFRSGFVAVVGRPNVGKSTLINSLVGTKVTIVSPRPQTTRHLVRGVLTGDGFQAVFVDTPGIHKPQTELGNRLNARAAEALGDVDVVVFMVDAYRGVGKGDQFVASRLPKSTIVAVNKTDRAKPHQIAESLGALAELGMSKYFAVSARSGDGVDALKEAIVDGLGQGPQYYPTNMRSDEDESFFVAELVREQLLARLGDELPHSVTTRVVEFEWPHIKCEILVERDSQKPIVIGKGGLLLKEVGTRVREQLEEGAYLELVVKVEKNWQRKAELLDRLGY